MTVRDPRLRAGASSVPDQRPRGDASSVRDGRLDDEPGPLVRAVARLARLLLPLPSRPPERIGSVLIVRTDDRVGNALLTVPLARLAQRLLPAARVELLLASGRAHVAEGLPDLLVIRFEKTDAFRHPLRFAKFLLAFRRRADVAIDAAHWHAFSLTSALLTRWTARRWAIGPARGPAIYSERVPLPLPGTFEVDAKAALAVPLAPVAGTAPALAPAVRAPPLETSLGRAPFVSDLREYVALNPGARKADHRWPAARYAALASALRARRGLRSLVLWGPGEEDLAREVVAASAGAARLAPATGLDELASALRGARLVITNDTGPMHLAVACGAPVLAVFLDDAGLRWGHPGERFAGLVAPDDGAALAAAERLLDLAPLAAEPSPSLQEVP